MKIECKKCKGYGVVPDMAERVFTLGTSWVFEQFYKSKIVYERCHKCNGKGKMKVQ